MPSQAFQVLLIGVVFACPWLCHVGPPCCQENGFVPAECCGQENDCPRQSPIDESPGVPVEPFQNCQCFCGNAIIPVTHEFLISENTWVEAALGNRSLTADSLSVREYFTLQPAHGFIVSGRELRCLHMSYLC